jgi:hypothetical protein
MQKVTLRPYLIWHRLASNNKISEEIKNENWDRNVLIMTSLLKIRGAIKKFIKHNASSK